ncbi:MAG: class I SAM-dependent methyltransferase [Defluviitaleaceae bacterium]|nr:class I SAM-dependent methyltransferase [Defluviitaleaceae bacterium]
MITEQFTGRAEAYANARPGYPKEAVEYIHSLAPEGAVFADIGAGTGKFTELLAPYGNKIFAVEPNADMREQLLISLAQFTNTVTLDGTAEATKIPDNSVDAIVCAQSLNKFNLDLFRTECRRIGKSNPIVVTLHNSTIDDIRANANYLKSTSAFYKNPAVKEFPNPVYFTREKWLLYHSSMAGVPRETDAGYEAYTAEINDFFDRGNIDGLLRLNLITKIYSEAI